MKGYFKVLGCCKQALLDGWKWAWIDSCCIDKTSSAELSEAINSMFLWYRESQVCYAYLSDVPSIEGRDEHTTKLNLGQSKWFTRGWTLQELLAPEYVIFYDENWTEIGTKASLSDIIEKRTGIKDLTSWEEACVAQKMSWAAYRETTRAEDLAYSLLGIFRVYMPPLYGEGDNAFQRLQLEIINKSDDESLFAWTSTDRREKTGLLAASPKNFMNSGDIDMIKLNNGNRFKREKPYSITNMGLRLEVALVQADLTAIKRLGAGFISHIHGSFQINEILFGKTIAAANVFLMPLNCFIPGKGSHCVVLILEKIFGSQFIVLRHEQHHFVQLPMAEGRVQKLAFIKQTVSSKQSRKTDLTFAIEVPVSDTEVTFVGNHYFKEMSEDSERFDRNWKPMETLTCGRLYAQEFSIDDGPSRSSFGVVLENEKGIPGVHLLFLDSKRKLEEEWKLYTKTSSYRRGVDRSSIVLPGETNVSAALRRMPGKADFKVETRIL